MIEAAVKRLEELCNIIPKLLTKIDEQTFSAKPKPEKWSKKEIIGHLIDSATNNHHRFVRAQFEDIPTIIYNQDNWNKYNYYNQMDIAQIVAFWTSYNQQLVSLIKLIPIENLQRKCNTGGKQDLTIEFLVKDYVDHLEHHLRQVVMY